MPTGKSKANHEMQNVKAVCQSSCLKKLLAVSNTYIFIEILEILRLKKAKVIRSTLSDNRFVVQIDADVEQREGKSNISLNLYNKSKLRRGSVKQMFYYEKHRKIIGKC